ncbi:YqaA family protein [Hylemonella sp. W303a]|uniref:YqaA family protein n=1 Tax=Hylemonella sp. W303a TaxID=3389873 RepID=UPI00396B4155
MMEQFNMALQQMLGWLALPEFGLSTLFVIAFISATLLPMGSEPAVVGLLHLNPDLFWPAMFVATAGNTLGGALNWWLGYGTHRAVDRLRHHDGEDLRAQASAKSPAHLRALGWLERLGPKACLLSWLPVVGDPLCAVAGWLKLPFWPCVAYMAVGKFLRYVTMTAALLWLIPESLKLL